MIPFPKSAPMAVGLGHVLPLIGHTKFGEEGPNVPLPTGIVKPMPMRLMLPPWGKGDPPVSIIGKLSHPLVKSKPRQRSWQISDPEFQKALQVARAVHPTDRMGEQHVLITCMSKHEKQQHHAKSTPPFTIQPGIVKELADTMQAWILNESMCSPAMRQLPNGTLNLLDIDFYTWMKNISPKEDTSVFKQQFWNIFTVSNWFNTLTNAKFHKDSSVSGCMCLCAPKKCPPLKRSESVV